MCFVNYEAQEKCYMVLFTIFRHVFVCGCCRYTNKLAQGSLGKTTNSPF